MDFKETLAALQGFLGADVTVAIWVKSANGTIPVLGCWGHCERGVRSPRRFDIEPEPGSVNFFVGTPANDGPGGTFMLSKRDFEGAEWSSDRRRLYIEQAGLTLTVGA